MKVAIAFVNVLLSLIILFVPLTPPHKASITIVIVIFTSFIVGMCLGERRKND